MREEHLMEFNKLLIIIIIILSNAIIQFLLLNWLTFKIFVN